MAVPSETKILAWWQEPQIQALIIKACASGGVLFNIANHIAAYFGWPTINTSGAAQYIIMGLPLVIEAIYSWWKNHPDNIVARAAKVIAGDNASPAALAKVTNVLAAKSP